MKKLFKKIVKMVLALEAGILLWRVKPEVIAITGSAGKTSTKELLTKLLEIDFEVLSPPEGYNTEFGAPLALFRQRVPKNVNSVLGWVAILAKNLFIALVPGDYPNKVVVEMGADSPGDIEYLARIFKPKVGVILTVLPTHLAEFKTEEAVATEKAKLAASVGEGGRLFLNSDDSRVKSMSLKTKAQVIYFGGGEENAYRAENIKSNLLGTEFTLACGGPKIKIKVRLYGKHMVYPLLAAIAVSREEGISIRKIQEELKEFPPIKGRMNVIEGINGSLIIDDSYNANPASMEEALEFLSEQKGRKIAILGSMNELGDAEEEAHKKIGQYAAGIVDLLVTVGELAGKYMAPAAHSAGLKISQARSFKTATEAGVFLKDQIKPDDVILVKGSQNKVRTEKAIEVIMKNPLDSKKLLVRQSEFWQEQP